MIKVKICGLRRMEDIEAVNRALPDYIGFVFAPSQRKIDIETAIMLKEKLNKQIKVVGVFVNEDINVISDIVKNDIIDLVQLHGDEDDLYINQLKESCNCSVIKSISVGATLPVLPEAADYLLFDTASNQRGGTGEKFDWSILSDYCGVPYFLAGGLSCENVNDAMEQLSIFCVDVSSGVETDGFKDANKIDKFIQMVRRMP